ncbi:MAG TPA: hypothetical protein VNC78_12040 [Actinomycetota bacterium]|nr:hypothetical protein [Actinomycetota bacterium]
MSDEVDATDLIERARAAVEAVRSVDRRVRVEAGKLRDPREAALATRPWAKARRDGLRETTSDIVDFAVAVLQELETARSGPEGQDAAGQIGVLEASLASLAEANDLLEEREAELRRSHDSSPGRLPTSPDAASADEVTTEEDVLPAREHKEHPRALVVARNALIAGLVALAGVAVWLFVIPHESGTFKDCVGSGGDETQCRCLDEAEAAGLEEEDRERFCLAP